MAFSKDHPCFHWMTDNIEYIEISDTTEVKYVDFRFSFFELEHITHTYGVRIQNSKMVNLLSYIADTKWCDSVESVLSEKPLYIIADMNGGNPNVHMSKDDFINKGVELTNGQTIFYGIHLSEEFESLNKES